MLALKIIATVFIGISFLTSTIHHLTLKEDEERSVVFDWSIIPLITYSISWRVLTIVAIWL